MLPTLERTGSLNLAGAGKGAHDVRRLTNQEAEDREMLKPWKISVVAPSGLSGEV